MPPPPNSTKIHRRLKEKIMWAKLYPLSKVTDISNKIKNIRAESVTKFCHKILVYRHASQRHAVSSRNNCCNTAPIRPFVEVIFFRETSWQARFPIIPRLISWLHEMTSSNHHQVEHYVAIRIPKYNEVNLQKRRRIQQKNKGRLTVIRADFETIRVAKSTSRAKFSTCT